AEVGEDEAHVLARRPGPGADFACESWLLGGLLDALAGAVELPAVVKAADRIALDPAEMELRTAMRAAIVEDLGAPGLAAIERVVLAHDADRLRVPGREVLAAVHCRPELPHELAARRAGPRRGDVHFARRAVKNDACHSPASSPCSLSEEFR